MGKYIGKCVSAGVLLALMVTAGSTFAESPQQWAFDFRYNIAGITQTLPANHKKECLAESAPILDISKPGHECKSRGYRWFGHTLIWQIDCSNEWESIQGTGRLHFDKGHSNGDIHLQIITPTGTPQYLSVDIQGQQLGTCKS